MLNGGRVEIRLKMRFMKILEGKNRPPNSKKLEKSHKMRYYS
jgi:hypothetical protein